MEITKVVKPFIRRGWPNTFGNIVYVKQKLILDCALLCVAKNMIHLQ